MDKHRKEKLLPECPFFHDSVMKGPNAVLICESPFPDSSMSFTYKYKSDRDAHQSVFCSKDYKNCSIYKYLMETVYKED